MSGFQSQRDRKKSPIQPYDGQSDRLTHYHFLSRTALELVQEPPNHHLQSTSPSSSFALVNWVVFSSCGKFNTDRFCLFKRSNSTSGSKVTDYRKLVRRAPQAVFGAYFLYFQSVFLYFRPLVKTRLSLLIQNVTLESEFGYLGPKLWSGGTF